MSGYGAVPVADKKSPGNSRCRFSWGDQVLIDLYNVSCE